MRISQRLRPDLLLPLAGGVCLAFFASRHLIAALQIIPSAPTLAAIRNQAPVSFESLVRLSEDEAHSLESQGSALGWSDLGMALAMMAEYSDAPHRDRLIGQASDALRTSLSLAPANPYVWTRLALVRQSAGAGDAELLRYLRLSWRTGPNEERLRLPRIELAFLHWGAVTAVDRPLLFDDIRNQWATDPDAIVKLAQKPFTANIVRAALLSDLPGLSKFEKAIAAGRDTADGSEPRHGRQ